MPRRLRIGVVAALERDVDQRIGDRVDVGFRDQRKQFRDVVIVHRVHRGQMRAATGRAGRAVRLGPASRYGATADRRSRRSACRPSVRARQRSRRAPSGRRAVGHGALEMRNAADDIDAHVESADKIRRARRGAIEAVLGKRHELQVEIGRDLFFTSSSASTESSRSSQTSTWLRIAPRPWRPQIAIAQRRSTTASG